MIKRKKKKNVIHILEIRYRVLYVRVCYIIAATHAEAFMALVILLLAELVIWVGSEKRGMDEENVEVDEHI